MSYRPEAPGAAAHPVRAASVGVAALQFIHEHARGQVCAKFARSLYVRFGAEAFVCIGAQSIGAGPLNVLVAHDDWLRLRAVEVGQPVEAARGALAIGVRYCIALTQAAPWHRARVATSLAAIPARLRTLVPIAQSLVPDTGLSRLAFSPASCCQADPVLRCARPGWDALERWVAGCAASPGPWHAPEPAASMLIGLGPGLTPSGDDVFCGVLIALKSLGCDHAAAALWSWLAPRLEQYTSALSAAHLAVAALGHGHSALHAALECSDAESAKLSDALRGLGQGGHCSGWDALAGAVLVWRAYAAHAPIRRIANSAA